VAEDADRPAVDGAPEPFHGRVIRRAQAVDQERMSRGRSTADRPRPFLS